MTYRDEDPELKATYAKSVRAKRCPCGLGHPVVGFFRARHRTTGRVAYLYSCQTCLLIEAGVWDTTRVAAPGEEAQPGQQQLML